MRGSSYDNDDVDDADDYDDDEDYLEQNITAGECFTRGPETMDIPDTIDSTSATIIKLNEDCRLLRNTDDSCENVDFSDEIDDGTVWGILNLLGLIGNAEVVQWSRKASATETSEENVNNLA